MSWQNKTSAPECQPSGEAAKRQPRPVQVAKEYIEAHSVEKFCLAKLSEALYINGSYLSRLFKSHTGQTLLEYHNSVRCERAKDLLRNTDMRISEIGTAVGFVSSAHFSHVFKKATSFTPSLYREVFDAEPSPRADHQS